MNQPCLKNFSFRFTACLFILFAAFIINSCRKEISRSKQSQGAVALTDHGINIGMLKDTYNKGINNSTKGKQKVTDISPQVFDKIISSLNVDWTTYTLFSYPDSTQVVEFAMPDDSSLLVPSELAFHDSIKYQSKTAAVFILNKDTVTMSFFMKTVENGSGAGYQPVINQLHYKQVPNTFTGDVLYFTLARQFLNGFAWSNGAITKALSLGEPASSQVNSISKLKTDELSLTNCVTTTYGIYNVTEDAQGNITSWQNQIGTITVTTCDIVDDGGTATTTTTSGGGAAGDTSTPNPQPCVPVASSPAVESIKGRLVIDVAAGGSGSGGSTSTASPCPTNPPPVVPPDPCAQIASVNTLAQNTKNTAIDRQLYNDTYTGHEYGDEENLTTWPSNGSYKNTAIRTDFNDTKFTANFTWNSSAGYTININHEHPAGDAPSPEDVFQLLVNMNNTDFRKAGAAAASYYKQNASITTITTNGTYVVMGADYYALATLASDYSNDPKAFDAKYESSANDHLSSSEYALLAIFGNSIYVYKSNPNTNTFSVLTFDKNGNVTTVICPIK